MSSRGVRLAVLIAAGAALTGQQRSGSALDAARASRQTGDLAKARQIYETALSDPQRDNRSEILGELAQVELALGDYPAAARHGEQCAAQPRVDAEKIAGCLTTAGQGRLLTGQYVEARAVFNRALDVARSSSLPEAEISILNNLGSVGYYQGAYADSFGAYEQARRLLETHPRAPWHDRLHKLTLANVAMLYQRVGQYERALGIYRELERTGGELKPSQRAQMISNIGALYRRLGDPYKAMTQYQAAEALYRTDRNRDGEIGVAKNTGIALAMDLHDYPAATAAFDRALTMAEHTGNTREAVQARLYLGETLRLAMRFTEAQRNLEQALEVARGADLKEERWRALVSLGRIAESRGARANALALYREAIAGIESLRSTLSQTQLRTTFLADKRDAYDGAIRCLLRDGARDSRELFRYMEQIRARVLREQTGTAGAPSLDEVQNRLPTDTALLELWRSGDLAGSLLITRRSASPWIVESLAPADVERLVQHWKDGQSAPEALAGKVGSALLATIRDLPREVVRLFVAPDRDLHALPFEALPLTNGGPPLIDHFEVDYVPSSAFVQPEHHRPRVIWPWQVNATIFADPTAPAGSEETLLPASIPRLPGAREEAAIIPQVTHGRSEVHAGSDNLRRYFDPARLRGREILHFATHGIADTDDPDRSRLVFSPEPGKVRFLFAREIAAVDLRQTSIVALASCDTEAGREVGGEGTAALSRAFLAAGARSTVSSLWKVDDRSSVEVMRRFYIRLARGEPAGAALRGAKLALRNSGTAYAHPRYWAPYVLNGDAGIRLGRQVRWSWVAIAAALLLAASIVLLWNGLNVVTRRKESRRLYARPR